MPFYIKKPTEPKEAKQLLHTAASILEITRFLAQKEDVGHNSSRAAIDKWDDYLNICEQQGGIMLKTPESNGETQLAAFGDFIMKGYSPEQGVHFWPIKPDYFEENYEQV